MENITTHGSECRKVNVIVVDDYADQRESLAELLSIYGIIVVGTGLDGKEAFELYKKFHPDVVLLDIMMPKYDGFYALSRIREYDPDARIIFTSGNVEDVKIDDPTKTFFMRKPIQMNNLLAIIRKIMLKSY